MSQEHKVSDLVCAAYSCLCWVSKEIMLFSAPSKDFSDLQFSCNERDREKIEGVVQKLIY